MRNPSSSIHLTSTRGLWYWSITIDGVAYQGTREAYKSATEAQSHAREALGRYRSLLASMAA
jgi:hypothetical protein